MTPLTDNQQAYLMLLVFILPVLIVWTGSGAPTDRVSLMLVVSGILSGIMVFIKERLGGTPPKTE